MSTTGKHVVAVAIDVGVDQLAMVIREGTVIGLAAMTGAPGPPRRASRMTTCW